MSSRFSVILGATMAFSILIGGFSTASVKIRTPRVDRLTSAGSGASLVLSIPGAWGTTWSYNPYNPNFPSVGANIVYLPLALQQPPKMTTLLPELASSWSVRGGKLLVRLQRAARWQNGSPVTSKDVVDTLILDGADGFAWHHISNVSEVGAHSVALTIRPGVPAALVESSVLTDMIYPASEYGKFVTPSLKADEIAYYAKAATDPAAAANMPQYKAISKVFTKLSSFAPTSMVGDGPFQLTHITINEAQLIRSPTFFDVGHIHTAGITELNTSQPQTIYAEMFTGRADFTNTYMPISIADKFVSHPGAHIALPPSFEQELVFNDHQYPLNMVKVRRALAYVISREDMATAAYGHGKYSDGQWAQQVDGLTPSVAQVWLTHTQIASLNPYHVDDRKATKLLLSSGFTKRGKTWIMPNGHPFALSLMMYNFASDGISSYRAATSDLTNFGIKSSVDSVPGAQVTADLDQGDFDMSINIVYNLDPLVEIDDAIGSSINFPKLGSYAGHRGIGFGPDVSVPGLGKVNVPSTIDQEASSTGPGPRMRQLTWDWARLVNQQVPFLTYDNKVYQFSYSTRKFADWPGPTSPLWSLASLNLSGGLLRMFQEGYVRPK